MALSAFQPPCSHRYPALPAPYKGRPLYVPTKTILTTLLSQILRTSVPCPHAKADPHVYQQKPFQPFFCHRYAKPALPKPLQRPTHTLTDRNHHSNQVVFTETPDKFAQYPCKRPTPTFTDQTPY